jgi:hypothetical protein
MVQGREMGRIAFETETTILCGRKGYDKPHDFTIGQVSYLTHFSEGIPKCFINYNRHFLSPSANRRNFDL